MVEFSGQTAGTAAEKVLFLDRGRRFGLDPLFRNRAARRLRPTSCRRVETRKRKGRGVTGVLTSHDGAGDVEPGGGRGRGGRDQSRKGWCGR